MKYLSWLAALGAFVISPVCADVTPCTGGGGATGNITCSTTRTCTTDAQCFGTMPGRCVRSGGSSNGVCTPSCNPLFRCNSPSDCPTFDPLVATCRPTTIPGVANLCEYHDPSARQFLTLCGAGNATLGDFRACFSAGGHWADGDCDGDGTLNGVDAAPCSAADTSTLPDVASPFCLGGQICEGTSTVCRPLVRCTAMSSECDAVAASIGTSGWECSALPVATSTPFCHPSCNPTAHCGGTVSCGALGSCRMVDATLSMCVPSTLASCASTCSPLDWASPQGDCDGDGAQNGCEPSSPCSVGTTAPCQYNHVCFLDAGVSLPDASISTNTDASVPRDAGTDASVNQSDANVSTPDTGTDIGTDASESPDANAARDAGRTNVVDGGGSAMDASAGIDAAALGFGGGGGCRCTAAGANVPTSRAGWLLAMLAVLGRRRRRP